MIFFMVVITGRMMEGYRLRIVSEAEARAAIADVKADGSSTLFQSNARLITGQSPESRRKRR
jgi:hypothetical protein